MESALATKQWQPPPHQKEKAKSTVSVKVELAARVVDLAVVRWVARSLARGLAHRDQRDQAGSNALPRQEGRRVSPGTQQQPRRPRVRQSPVSSPRKGDTYQHSRVESHRLLKN